MMRLMIEFRNSIKKSKDSLLHRISLNAFTCTGINSDQKYSNGLKMAQNLGNRVLISLRFCKLKDKSKSR